MGGKLGKIEGKRGGKEGASSSSSSSSAGPASKSAVEVSKELTNYLQKAAELQEPEIEMVLERMCCAGVEWRKPALTDFLPARSYRREMFLCSCCPTPEKVRPGWVDWRPKSKEEKRVSYVARLSETHKLPTFQPGARREDFEWSEAEKAEMAESERYQEVGEEPGEAREAGCHSIVPLQELAISVIVKHRVPYHGKVPAGWVEETIATAYMNGWKISRGLPLTVDIVNKELMPFTVNLSREAQHYLNLIGLIDTDSRLADKSFVEKAILRTGRFLQLCAHQAEKNRNEGYEEFRHVKLIPTFDVMAVLASFLIRNQRYNAYCTAHHSAIDFSPPHAYVSPDGLSVIQGGRSIASAEMTDVTLTGKYYSAIWGDPWPLSLKEIEATPLKLTAGESKGCQKLTDWVLDPKDANWLLKGFLSADEVLRDRQWLPQVLQHLQIDSLAALQKDKTTLHNCLLQYQRLWFMCRAVLNMDPVAASAFEGCVPPSADIFWHTHLIHPARYAIDCYRYLRGPVSHDPWPSPLHEIDQASGLQLFQTAMDTYF